ncbi:MAG: hypothetical protein AB1405_00250 [Bdellovibrionota bacterium]
MSRLCVSFALFFAICFAACSFKIPTPLIIDSKTALEAQVVGEYEPLADDLLLLASLPGVARRAAEGVSEVKEEGEEGKRLRDAQARLLQALRSQEYNRDDLSRFRREGWMGESASGRIHVFEDRLAGLDLPTRERVRVLTEEENRDREGIVVAVIEIAPDLGPEDKPELEQVFARQYIGRAEAGAWVEQPAGQWHQLSVGDEGGNKGEGK